LYYRDIGVAKRGIASDIFKYIPNIKSVKFIEEIVKPEEKEEKEEKETKVEEK
ncbi:MAG: hypothetical protein J7L07_01500, partial [Candidatus Odinarchaeota archaeon]|nr:hypothetical protein [Candidatus Odinarchaeota archaeon]